MRKPIILILFIFGLIFLLLKASFASAGFGISPPYIRNENLVRGSRYEQKIVLVRGEPTEDLKAQLVINVSGANDWISIDKGTEFILPKGEKKVPIVVKVDVPRQAKFGEYKGTIRIKTSPLETEKRGGVSIALGAQIDVDLRVIKKEIIDFAVRGVKVQDLEEGHKFWWMDFPGKIKFMMRIENKGNVEVGPSKVTIDIYDTQGEKLLEKLETRKIGKVPSFETGEVIAYFLTNLKPGSYSARYKIFKGEEIVAEGELSLSILPYGTIPDYQGANFFDLSLGDKLIFIFGILILGSGLVCSAWWIYKFTKRKGFFEKRFFKKNKLSLKRPQKEKAIKNEKE